MSIITGKNLLRYLANRLTMFHVKQLGMEHFCMQQIIMYIQKDTGAEGEKGRGSVGAV